MAGDPYYSDQLVTLYLGDCVDVLRSLPDDSADAVVTDPPYGLEFMGKEWDRFGADTGNGYREKPRMNTAEGFGGYKERPNFYTAGHPYQRWCEQWAHECLRVLKPGGHMLAFGGTRTSHRLASAIEDAGFELRDTIAWLYGSGFPKSRNLDGDWQGWGTALKPANEPIIVARKPLAGTVTANVLTYGTGALNIDACRVGDDVSRADRYNGKAAFGEADGYRMHKRDEPWTAPAGRWPTNVVLDADAAAELDRQSGTLRSGLMRAGITPKGERNTYGKDAASGYERTADTYGDSGGAARFFPTFRYEAKAPQHERPGVDGVQHPTVKPLDLMRWLVRLVTPPGGVVLEPFAGSGTTAEACIVEGFRCIAIEREPDYIPLILARITKPIEPVLFGESA